MSDDMDSFAAREKARATPDAGPSSRWPRLSEDLPGLRDLDRCQSCGVSGTTGEEIVRWLEYDDQDQPEGIVVLLCRLCHRKLIEPHPRLYRALQEHEPLPGSIELCRDCTFRDGVSCTHPDLKANGGEGLLITIRPPYDAHVLRQTRHGRRGSFERVWTEPASRCAGREVEDA